MEISSEPTPKKSKRLTSVVWNHFERVKKADICYAVCLHCKKKLSGSSNSGTTHLRNHLVRCLKRSNFDVSQILSAKRKRKESPLCLTNVNLDEGPRKDEIIGPITYKFDQDQKKDETNQAVNLGGFKFDQDRSRLDLTRMIMLHGYSLSMVEHVGFRLFVRNLQPLFDIPSCSSLEQDCTTIYENERQKVYEMIHNLHGRISLDASTWISHENARFLCLTAYFIDEEWKSQRKILNFVTLDPYYTDDVFSEFLYRCLTDWDIDRMLFSMTFDDRSTSDDVVVRIKGWLSQSKPLLKNGELFDVRCVADVVQSIVQDALEALRDVIVKIREGVTYVRSSQATQTKFYELAQEAGINSERRLFLDCSMSWNSTYLMLETVLDYKGAFTLLQEQDPAYSMSLSEKEWDWTNTLTCYLKLFVEVMSVISSDKYRNANIYFPEICDVHIQLIEWCKNPDDFVRSIALKMKSKFDRYWNKCSLTLAIAAILDPRFKMKLVEYYYPQIYDTDASGYIKKVSDGIRELFNEYSLSSTDIDQALSWPDNTLPGSSNGSRDRLRGFDKFLHETSKCVNKLSDLEKYLEEAIFPRNHDFNILNWWKVHTPKYPVLSMLARDILGIPVSTLPQELVFCTGGRVLDQYKSSLNSEIRQALICGQDWLHVERDESSSHQNRSVVLFGETN